MVLASIAMDDVERIPCPACGGAGGGPFGRAGSAWDDEDWVCPRCEGEGQIAVVVKPGLAKTATREAEPSERKRTG